MVMNQMVDHDEDLNIRALEKRLSELRGALSAKAIQIVKLRMETRRERQAIHELTEFIDAARRSLEGRVDDVEIERRKVAA